jgi:hypothetical protein
VCVREATTHTILCAHRLEGSYHQVDIAEGSEQSKQQNKYEARTQGKRRSVPWRAVIGVGYAVGIVLVCIVHQRC